MWEKPIQKEHIACRTGERQRRHIREHLWRNRKLPIGALLVWVRLLIYARQHFQCPVGVCGINQRNPASHDHRTAIICRILMPRTACLRKAGDIYTYTDDLPGHLLWGHESRDVIHQPWMLG